MALPPNTRIGERINAVVRIKLKHRDVNTFVERYSGNISRGGIFIASRTPQPIGSTLGFEFSLAQGDPIIRGEGEVVWVKHFDDRDPDRPHGMGVRFTWLDDESRAIIDRAIAFKDQERKMGRAGAASVFAQTKPRSEREDTQKVVLPDTHGATTHSSSQQSSTRRIRKPTADELSEPAEATQRFTRSLDEPPATAAPSTAAMVASAMADLDGEPPARTLAPVEAAARPAVEKASPATHQIDLDDPLAALGVDDSRLDARLAEVRKEHAATDDESIEALLKG